MGVCDVPVISSVCDAVGEGAASLVAAPFDWLAQAMGAAAGWLFEAVWSVFDTTTLVDVTKPGYIAVYNLLFGIAVFVMLIFFCLQLITGLIRRDPTALTRAALGLAKSVLGSFVVITLTALLLEVVDQLCIGIVQAAGETTESMGDKIALLAAGLVGINIAAPGVGAIITIFMAGLAITAAAIVWLSLLVTESAPAGRGRVRAARVQRRIVGCLAGVDREVGDVRRRADLLQARARRDVPRRDHPGLRTDRRRPRLGQRSHRGDRADGDGRVRAVPDVQVHRVRRVRHVPRDRLRAGRQERPQPPDPGPDQAARRRRPEEGARRNQQRRRERGRRLRWGSSAPPPPKTPAPAPAASGGGAAGGGAAAGGGGAAAAGPVAAGVVVGASVAKGAATAGPKAGTALGAQGEHAADAAAQTPPPPAASPAAPPSSPAPRPPSTDPSPPPKQPPPPAPRPPKE